MINTAKKSAILLKNQSSESGATIESGKRGPPQREVTGGEPQVLRVPEIPSGCLVLCFDYCHMGKSKFVARLHPSSKRKPSKRKQKLTLKKQKHKIEFLQCIVHSM